MMRGSNRWAMPTTSSGGFINPDGPAPGWTYWEERFGDKFSIDLRKAIALKIVDFNGSLNAYNKPRQYAPRGREFTGRKSKDHDLPRLDRKQLTRYLQSIAKTGSCRDETILGWMEAMFIGPPDADRSEKAKSVLRDLEQSPGDLLVERADPKRYCAGNFFELFREHGHNVSCGSKSLLEGAHGMDPMRPTPLIEFIARVVYAIPEEAQITVAHIRMIQKAISRETASRR